ncbi:MAG: hypothetical protein ACHQ4H_12630 [Ktedonobacterales bacterium]|jgi:hypothetical protein
MRNGSDGNNGDSWDAFDWMTWGEEPSAADGHGGEMAGRPARNESRTSGDDDERRAPEGGAWVSEGGVLHWQRPGDVDEEEIIDAASEVNSRWATDDVDLPPGAPDTLRVRAARAWLLRQRANEGDALGYLLLERRKLAEARSSGDDADETEAEPHPDDPLALALAEHQAAIEEYERLLAELDDIADHTGPSHVLVEFYLRLGERLAELASQPEAPAEFADVLLMTQVEDEESAPSDARAPSPRASAEWQGRADAALLVRRRVERVTAPEPED